MASMGCRGFLSFILKFLNFLQAFVGVAIILYSVWMLSHWNHRDHIPPASAPFPENAGSSMLNLYGSEVPKNRKLIGDYDCKFPKLSAQMSSGLQPGVLFSSEKFHTPWFIYSSMSVGITLCIVACVGYIAAEIINGCCLLLYSSLTTILILLEAALAVYILLNKHWEKDLPNDPTGEFDNLRSFVQENIEICKIAGLIVIIIQALSLLLATILRAMVTRRRAEYASGNEDDYLSVNHRQPLLIPKGEQSSTSTSTDCKSIRADAWSLRMREKYGLNPNEFRHTEVDPKASEATTTTEDDIQRR